MKTLTKTIAAFAGLLLLAGCSAAAEDAAPKTAAPAYGPGWRHEQMMQARQDGKSGPGPMMMQRTGRMGPPLNADGTVDTTRLPDWCPYKQPAPDAAAPVAPATK